MGALTKIIIVILILLVVGLYFKPHITKSLMKVSGHAVADAGKKAIDKAQDVEIVRNVSEKVKEKVLWIVEDKDN